MLSKIKTHLRKAFPNTLLAPEGEAGVKRAGHRKYVGGMWDEIGQLQFDFLLSQGLRPEHYLLDVACGALRLGVKAIPYLEPGHYLGIEKEKALVDAGLEKELDADTRQKHAPNIVISSDFEFEKLGHQADYAIAQSLFTHLPTTLIDTCFQKLFPVMTPRGTFFATFFRSERETKNPDAPHDHGVFVFTETEMLDFGNRAGFESRYIGDWKHPRNQVMVAYTRPRPA